MIEIVRFLKISHDGNMILLESEEDLWWKWKSIKEKEKEKIKHVLQKESRSKDINELGNRKAVFPNKYST